MGKYRKYFFAGIILFAIFIICEYQYHLLHTVRTWNLPLSGKVVVIDPGHGGPDGGASGGEVIEKEVALKISLYLRDYLQQQGAFVIMTREEDKDLAHEDTYGYSKRKSEDLHKRVKVINRSKADIFLSIHLNALPISKYSGAQTFYALGNEGNRRLAALIQDEFRLTLGNTTRIAKPIQNIYLLRKSEVPGALVEVGFVSNPTERELLGQKEYQEKLAFTIYKGIMRNFSKEKGPEE